MAGMIPPRGPHRLERDLATPVAEWCRARGLTVYSEVPCFQRRVDMIGLSPSVDRAASIAVELKRTLTPEVIAQASPLRFVVGMVYCGIGRRPPGRSPLYAALRRDGLGLLVVDGLGAYEALPPRPSVPASAGLAWARVLEHCRREGPSDDAGRPSEPGKGPAQAVLRAVRRYLAQHPFAEWDEIHERVTSHYRRPETMLRGMARLDPELELPLFRGAALVTGSPR